MSLDSRSPEASKPDAHEPPRPVRILVGEDQPFVREGIVLVLQEGGFEVVAAAADARELVQLAAVYHPDVVVADIQMPPGHSDDGLRAALDIRAAQPGVGVLVLSQFLEDAYAFALVADAIRARVKRDEEAGGALGGLRAIDLREVFADGFDSRDKPACKITLLELFGHGADDMMPKLLADLFVDGAVA